MAASFPKEIARVAIETAIDTAGVAGGLPGRVTSGVAPVVTLTAGPTQEGVAFDGRRGSASLVPLEKRQVPIERAELKTRETQTERAGATSALAPRQAVVPLSPAEIGAGAVLAAAGAPDTKGQAEEVGTASGSVVVPACARETNGPPRRVPAAVVPPSTACRAPASLRLAHRPLARRPLQTALVVSSVAETGTRRARETAVGAMTRRAVPERITTEPPVPNVVVQLSLLPPNLVPGSFKTAGPCDVAQTRPFQVGARVSGPPLPTPSSIIPFAAPTPAPFVDRRNIARAGARNAGRRATPHPFSVQRGGTEDFWSKGYSG